MQQPEVYKIFSFITKTNKQTTNKPERKQKQAKTKNKTKTKYKNKNKIINKSFDAFSQDVSIAKTIMEQF